MGLSRILDQLKYIIFRPTPGLDPCLNPCKVHAGLKRALSLPRRVEKRLVINYRN